MNMRGVGDGVDDVAVEQFPAEPLGYGLGDAAAAAAKFTIDGKHAVCHGEPSRVFNFRPTWCAGLCGRSQEILKTGDRGQRSGIRDQKRAARAFKGRLFVGPTSWSAVLAASPPPEPSFVHLSVCAHRDGAFDPSVGRETHATAGQEAGATKPLTRLGGNAV